MLLASRLGLFVTKIATAALAIIRRRPCSIILVIGSAVLRAVLSRSGSPSKLVLLALKLLNTLSYRFLQGERRRSFAKVRLRLAPRCRRSLLDCHPTF